jgi:Uma2 family endonuclease
MAMAITVPRYTVDDLENFPDDGNRYELLDGLLLVTPAPAASHQLVASRIQGRLIEALQWTGHAHVVGPGAIVRRPGTQLEPDILVYPARFSPNLDWPKITEHWLAVEIVSRSSRIYDREFKVDAYFALGVQQVWLAERRDKSIEVWRSHGVNEVARDVVRWRVPTVDIDVALDLGEVFAGLD